jgi:hypothetical protein
MEQYATTEKLLLFQYIVIFRNQNLEQHSLSNGSEGRMKEHGVYMKG